MSGETPPALFARVDDRAADPDEPAGVATLPERPGGTEAGTGAPTSMFERLDSRLAGKVVVDENMRPAFREQYRKLAAALHQAQAVSGLKVIIIASAVAEEGKTLTAANLALTFSESYQRRVLLIDGDLRRPSLHALFRVSRDGGLSQGLFAEEERRIVVHQISTRLALLPAGPPISDPMAGLTSDRMRRVIQEGRDAFDWVIVDTPPVGVLPDAHLLASLGDGALMVIRASGPAYGVVQRAIELLGRDRILGIVLNRAEVGTAESYSYRYDYRPTPHAASS